MNLHNPVKSAASVHTPDIRKWLQTSSESLLKADWGLAMNCTMNGLYLYSVP